MSRSAEGAILRTEAVGKEFGGVWVLRDVDFDLKDGEVHALIGENGAGKSTLVKIFSGVLRQSAGRVFLHDEVIAPRSAQDCETLGIRTVHQEIHQVPFMSVAENIFVGSEVYNRLCGLRIVDRKRMNSKASELLEQLGVDIDVRWAAQTLDASHQRIVEISRAFSREPKVLILDEPTTSLAERERDRLLRVIEELKGHISIIYVSHNLDEILRLSNRVTVLRDGAKVATVSARDTSEGELIRLMIGRKSYSVFERSSADSCDVQKKPILSVEGICNRKLENISLSVAEGEIVGIAGAVGAGKTELAKAIFGIDPITAGEIRLEGEALQPCPQGSVEKGIALIPEERQQQGLVLGMPVYKNVTMAYVNRWARANVISSPAEHEATREFIKALAIRTSGPHQLVRHLSGGNQQKVVLSRWLAGDFKVGLFDDATRGIDINAKQDIYRLIENLSKRGKAVLWFSSYLPELLSVCHRIVVLSNGRIVGEFTPDEESVEERILAAMLGGKSNHESSSSTAEEGKQQAVK